MKDILIEIILRLVCLKISVETLRNMKLESKKVECRKPVTNETNEVAVLATTANNPHANDVVLDCDAV